MSKLATGGVTDGKNIKCGLVGECGGPDIDFSKIAKTPRKPSEEFRSVLDAIRNLNTGVENGNL